MMKRTRFFTAPSWAVILLLLLSSCNKENASTESLKKLHRMVTAVKRDGEVGLAYMKSFEREARI